MTECCKRGQCCTPSVPATNHRLSFADWMGAIAVRLGWGRGWYRVEPGLYRIGEPDSQAPVLVTANYKLTFDMLRRHLKGLSLWLLVLDTNGINVWCAAGNGSFGTHELVSSLQSTGLAGKVSHRSLVLPQLGAPGVAAHEVLQKTGFNVEYGPVRAEDIAEYLQRGKATEEMRQVRFGFWGRLQVTPLELIQSSRLLVPVLLLFAIWNLVQGSGLAATAVNMLPYLGAWLAGGLLVPLLLPWLPFRSFALNGATMGLIPAGLLWRYPGFFGFSGSPVLFAANLLLLVSLSAFIALNFTGATTFTSHTGVRLETSLAVPVLISAVSIAVVLLFVALIMQQTGWL